MTAIQQPTGRIAFLFTDIEGSSTLWERWCDAMSVALLQHDRLLRDIAETYRGYIFKTLGDGFYVAFQSIEEALAAASEIHMTFYEARTSGALALPLKIRMAIHVGTPIERDGDYLGPVVNRTARLLLLGRGEQIFLSESAAMSLLQDGGDYYRLEPLGVHNLKGLTTPERVFRLRPMKREAGQSRDLRKYVQPAPAMPLPA